MLEYQDLNDSLQNHIDEGRVREKEADVKTERLHDAENKIDRLRKALKETERKAIVSTLLCCDMYCGNAV